MPDLGKYIYCIIESNNERNFGPIGIGGRGDNVTTVGYRDLSAVVSNTIMEKYVIGRENMMAHERVIEEVMKEYTVLPVRFCTIATSAEELRNLLRRRYPEFKKSLRSMDGKVELGLKARWRDESEVIREVTEENAEVREEGSRLAKAPGDDPGARDEKVELGKKVKALLEEKRKEVAEKILMKLRKAAVDILANQLTTDDMVLNAAFLVDRFHEREFDSLVGDLEDDIGERVALSYVGPAPPFNFVNISVEWTQEAG
ncbi:MAG: GvpL/GvpF family gas vesicle protein [Actinobacteria bacterium]|nr:GvpL/GvpF family gas vesicle protein [Actinomycetota bacterium]MBU4385975.1 GvpL/GvpF family gas vesicle protein [Actinomycetota bacterium]